MLFSAVLRRAFQKANAGRRCQAHTLSLEVLEDRWCPSYSIIDVGTLPGATSSQALAVNQTGQVVGDSGGRAFLWENGVMTDLGTLGGGTSSAADVNDAGQVVGAAKVDALFQHAFLSQNGVMTDLGTLGNRSSSASAINNTGQIVGTSDVSDNIYHAFVWEGGMMYDLAALLPAGSGWARLTEANDINNSGQIVGWGVKGGQERAFLMSDPDGVFGNGGAVITDLGTLSGGSSSYGQAINGAGQVAGWATARRDLHAFRYSGGAMTDLKTLGGPHSQAYGINDAGQVVGTSQTIPRLYGDNPLHAFLWQKGKMTDLNKLLPGGSGWTLGRADDINDVGWIVGSGAINGQDHAFLMIPNAALQAESVATTPVTETIELQQVESLFTEALTRWQSAGVETSGLTDITIRIADLGGNLLGLAAGNTIWLDDNAAGWGWFPGAPGPWDDSEFTTPGDQGEQNRMDLLTVLMHEMGHVLGHDHNEDGVMAKTLSAGTRLTLHGVDVQESWWLAGLPDTTKKRDVFGWWL